VYIVKFQNCTITNIASSSTTGGAVTSFPSTGGTVEILGCVFSNINLTSTGTTSGGFVYCGTTPQFIHIHDSSFSFATVWIHFYLLMFFVCFDYVSRLFMEVRYILTSRVILMIRRSSTVTCSPHLRFVFLLYLYQKKKKKKRNGF
jgi:hypothetical protein